MQHDQAALLGVLRSMMAQGMRGSLASAQFTVVRPTNDQILGNATGVGAPPATCPRGELAADIVHKTVYTVAIGAVADALAARGGPGPGQKHAGLRPARQASIGPLPQRRARG